MTDRIPPQDLDAEQFVIGACMVDAFGRDAAATLRPEDFYRHSHQEIFRSILWLSENRKAVTPQTVASILRRNDLLEEIGGSGYLEQCWHRGALTSSAPTHVENVSTLATMRRIQEAAWKVGERACQPYEAKEDVTDYAERTLLDAIDSGNSGNGKQLEFDEAAGVVFSELEQAALNPSRITGTATGFSALDFATCGLQRGELILLAARTSVGKSAFAGQIAMNVAKPGGAVAYYSFEMPAPRVAMRMLAIEARINLQTLRSGRMSREEHLRLLDARKTLNSGRMVIEDTSDLTTVTLRSRLRRLHRETPLSLVIVDHIGIMTPAEKVQTRYLELGHISRDLLRIAIEFNIPVLALAQVGRPAKDRKPDLADLRESGNLEQDARTVLLIHRPKFNDDKHGGIDPEPCEIIIAKNNNGPRNVHLPFRFVPGYAAFEPDEKELPEIETPRQYREDTREPEEYSAPVVSSAGTGEALVGSFMTGFEKDPFDDD